MISFCLPAFYSIFSLTENPHMKGILYGLVLLLCLTTACKKKGGAGDGPCTETGLAFTSSPAVGTVQTPAPGPNFPVQVTLSNIPSAGATITVTARPESSGPAFYTETRNSSQAANAFNITNTPLNVVSIVEIKVVSASCNTNKAEGSYRFSRK